MTEFQETQHPRDQHGRFADAGAAPSFRQTPLRESSAGPQRRSLTRGEAWQRIGAKLSSLPVEYTGSREKEPAVDRWQLMAVKWQAPNALPVKDHMALLGRLKALIQDRRDRIIEKAKTTRQWVAVHGAKDQYTLKRRTGDVFLDPNTSAGTANRAYNHAAMLALHDFGVLDYDFKMGDALKDEMQPVTSFVRFARRSLGQQMKGQEVGAWRPYRAEFGQKFPNPKYNPDGSERLRVRPNDVLVKDATDAAFDETKHPRDQGGRFAGVGRKLAIGAGVAAGLGAAYVGAPMAYRHGLLRAGAAFASAKAGEDLTRGTRPVPLATVFRRPASEAVQHIRDIFNNPTAVGKAPTRKELRRQFARDSFMRRERMIVTDKHGEVLGNKKGTAFGVQVDQSAVLHPDAARTFHNHPVDTAPSTPDALMAASVDHDPDNGRLKAGLRGLRHYVYGISGVQGSSKIRTRLTRFDSGIAGSAFKTRSREGNRHLNDLIQSTLRAKNLTESDWQGFAREQGSNYRTAAVEKRFDIDRRLRSLQRRRDPDGIEARKGAPGLLLTEAEVRAAARSVQTPTKNQAAAGNYQKGHLTVAGLRIAIETPKGRMRRGVGPTGIPWSVKMPAHYGYFKGSEGADGDHVDCYLGPKAHQAALHPVYVVDQVKAGSGKFDEHKVLMGFPSRNDAIGTYDAAFSDGRGSLRRGAVTTMSVNQLKRWLAGGDTKEPLALAKAVGVTAPVQGVSAAPRPPRLGAPPVQG